MMYIEMSRTQHHGGQGWEFATCLWSPTRKKAGNTGKDGSRWAFWEKVHAVRRDDIIFHLKGIPPNAHFVGTSKAACDGYITRARPPEPGKWSSGEYYRVDLEDFVPFVDNINLIRLFAAKETELTHYFEQANIRKPKRNLFYVVKRRGLQCQNGGYLSDLDDELFDVLFSDIKANAADKRYLPIISVKTAEQLRFIKSRLGQKQFSEAVKKLFDWKCCFPCCPIKDDRFLVGAHIARWSDNPSLRGDLRNGLCLCVFHDRAFEKGLFTLDRHQTVYVKSTELTNPNSAVAALQGAHGQRISDGGIALLEAALQQHWELHKFELS